MTAMLASVFSGIEESAHLLLLPDGSEVELINNTASQDAVGFSPTREPLQLFPASERNQIASFSCLNWPLFTRRGDTYLPNGATLALVAEGWSVGIKPADDAKRRLELLREVGGFVSTHAGTLARVDGAEFSGDDLRSILSVLHYFFAFALGARTGPCFTHGVSPEGLTTYLDVGVGQVTPDLVPLHSSWVDSHHPVEMEELFPLFVRLIARDPWRKSVKDTLYWYLSGNRLGSGVHVDSALVFALTGLELLSWTTLVLDRKVLSRTQFKNCNASMKVRHLMKHLGIPTEIPNTLPSLLSQAARIGEHTDLPDVLVSMRNDLVHPETKHEVVDGAYYEAWRAGQWALEVTLLAVMGYRGTYGNRMRSRRVGQVESVPWA